MKFILKLMKWLGREGLSTSPIFIRAMSGSSLLKSSPEDTAQPIAGANTKTLAHNPTISGPYIGYRDTALFLVVMERPSKCAEWLKPWFVQVRYVGLHESDSPLQTRRRSGIQNDTQENYYAPSRG